jgi:predicted kinase
MDLDYEGYPEISQSLVKAYVQCAKDRDAFVLLNFYKCYRALVRVKVDCFRLQGGGAGAKEASEILRETERYMTLAYQYALQYTRPTLWVVCGLPASGKSTIARELSRVLGAKVFRSDVIRKELFDMEPLDRRDGPFGEGIYSKGASSLTYGRLLLLAQEEIEKGSPVILDATYGRRHERNNVFLLAKDMDVNLVFVECICADFKLKERLKQRDVMASVSDARLHHFEQINALFEPLNDVPRDMYIKVDTDVPLEQSLAQILSEEYALESVQAAEAIKD